MPHIGLEGQGLLQLGELLLALVLSALVGLEREFRQKSAGLRTYALVGVASALFMLISKYGYMDVLAAGRVVLDPSRVAAQIVSGIGFIGGGVIFLRQDVVRGLTTAASVWLTAALGMACGAGLPILAIATTAGHLAIMFLLPKLVTRLPRIGHESVRLRIAYEDGKGLLRDILITCCTLRFAVEDVAVERDDLAVSRDAIGDLAGGSGPELETRSKGIVIVAMTLKGQRPATDLIAALGDIAGVAKVTLCAEEPGIA